MNCRRSNIIDPAHSAHKITAAQAPGRDCAQDDEMTTTNTRPITTPEPLRACSSATAEASRCRDGSSADGDA